VGDGWGSLGVDESHKYSLGQLSTLLIDGLID